MRLALALITVTMAGCAATPTISEQSQVEASQHPEVRVRVESDPAMRKVEGYEETAAELLQYFTDNLRASGKFARVTTDAPAPGTKVYEVRLAITSLNYVHGAGRAMVGILAGRAVLGVEMAVTDLETGKELGRMSASHASHHGQGVFSPTTSRQAEAIAKQLSERLVAGPRR
ncbi:MAG TPA: DUF4410 domain-containing protein [Burkholderiales bacterium]